MDIIDLAINKTKEVAQGNSTISNIQANALDAVSQAQQKISEAQQKAADIENRANELKDKYENIKDKFPAEPDLDLIKQRARAKALEKKAELDRALEQASELKLDDLRAVLSEYQVLLAPLGFKLPVISPKVLQAVAIAKQIKDVYKFRQELSKENLKNGIKTYTYPIKKIVPEIPELPTVESLDVPELPDIPDLPFKKDD